MEGGTVKDNQDDSVEIQSTFLQPCLCETHESTLREVPPIPHKGHHLVRLILQPSHVVHHDRKKHSLYLFLFITLLYSFVPSSFARFVPFCGGVYYTGRHAGLCRPYQHGVNKATLKLLQRGRGTEWKHVRLHPQQTNAPAEIWYFYCAKKAALEKLLSHERQWHLVLLIFTVPKDEVEMRQSPSVEEIISHLYDLAKSFQI